MLAGPVPFLDEPMFFTKTEKARDELRPGRRTLAQRERALLLMADGQRSVTDFAPLFASRDEARKVAQRLLSHGYLAPPPAVPQPEPAASPSEAADTFAGKRSLATTRMFLFDLCERMFARRDPELAESLREMLRQARDRDSMLAAVDTMLSEIRTEAGDERADQIDERIRKLLPPETRH